MNQLTVKHRNLVNQLAALVICSNYITINFNNNFAMIELFFQNDFLSF